jgi:hypothetical protein
MPLPPIQVNGEVEYEVEAIIDSKLVRNQLKYLVHWKGYTVMDRTWEPASNLSHCKEMVKKFHQAHPQRPGSARGARR